VNAVSFSPDGKVLASGSADGQVRRYQASDPQAAVDPSLAVLASLSGQDAGYAILASGHIEFRASPPLPTPRPWLT
jgi:WD40 repeat protein